MTAIERETNRIILAWGASQPPVSDRDEWRYYRGTSPPGCRQVRQDSNLA